MKNPKSESNTPSPEQPPTREWVRPQLKSVGNVGEVLQGGGGKLSLVSQDPGDTRKQTGQG